MPRHPVAIADIAPKSLPHQIAELVYLEIVAHLCG